MPFKKFEIKPLKSVSESSIVLDPVVPKPQFSLILVGRSGSGKTTTLTNLINYYVQNKVFHPDNVILFSPSIGLDKGLEEIKCTWRYDHFNEEIIDNVFEQQKALITGKEDLANNVLLIADDCISEKKFGKIGSKLEMLFYRCRHVKISLMLSVQKLNAISRGIRTNQKQLIIYRPFNGTEMDLILSEHSDKKNRSAFRNMLRDIYSSSPYAFLYIDYLQKDKNKRYSNSMKEYISVEGEDNKYNFDLI
jgi:ABC-type dipeptide/oligopeptide/nickel transport system ATPase component